jgi:putative membrane protein
MEAEGMKYPRLITATAAVLPGLLSTPGPAYSQWSRGPGYMHSFWGKGMGWTGMVFFLLILILIAVAVILVVRGLLQNNRSKINRDVSDNSSGKALEILNERYARGEIDREEYQRKKQDLS